MNTFSHLLHVVFSLYNVWCVRWYIIILKEDFLLLQMWPLFWSYTWFRSIVVEPCFIRRHKSTQKLFRIGVNICQIFFWSGHTNLFLVDCEQSRHPPCIELSHAQMCMQNIDYTLSWDKYDLSYLMHFHFRGIQNNIMDFLNHFWCSDLIWMTLNWYGFCAHTTTAKFGKLLLNHFMRRSRVRKIFIELGLGFW